MSWLNRKKKHTLVSSNRLTNDEHQELERVLMNCQIEPVSDALIPYLSRMKSLLREYKNGKILFKERFIKICEYLEALKQNPKYALNEFKQKAHINALTLLGSIKIMVFDLSDEVNRHNPKSEVSNSYFIKRLPPNLRLHLSPDSWRLYEVYALLYQSEKEIVLNKDLLEDFPKMGGASEKLTLETKVAIGTAQSALTAAELSEAEPTPVKDNLAKPSEELAAPEAAQAVEPESEAAFSVEGIFDDIFEQDTQGELS